MHAATPSVFKSGAWDLLCTYVANCILNMLKLCLCECVDGMFNSFCILLAGSPEGMDQWVF